MWVRDLSRGGIGLMHTSRLASGFEFLVPLPRLDGDAETLVAQVVYCGTAAPEMFSIGARFTGRSPLKTTHVPVLADKT